MSTFYFFNLLDGQLSESEILSYADYYPFGWEIPTRSFSNPNKYRFGFGGHEIDDEIVGAAGHVSFGNFGYSPRLARRWKIKVGDKVLAYDEFSKTKDFKEVTSVISIIRDTIYILMMN